MGYDHNYHCLFYHCNWTVALQSQTSHSIKAVGDVETYNQIQLINQTDPKAFPPFTCYIASRNKYEINFTILVGQNPEGVRKKEFSFRQSMYKSQE